MLTRATRSRSPPMALPAGSASGSAGPVRSLWPAAPRSAPAALPQSPPWPSLPPAGRSAVPVRCAAAHAPPSCAPCDRGARGCAMSQACMGPEGNQQHREHKSRALTPPPPTLEDHRCAMQHVQAWISNKGMLFKRTDINSPQLTGTFAEQFDSGPSALHCACAFSCWGAVMNHLSSHPGRQRVPLRLHAVGLLPAWACLQRQGPGEGTWSCCCQAGQHGSSRLTWCSGQAHSCEDTCAQGGQGHRR